MNLGLASMRVLVTAGASGIGLAIAREFVNEVSRASVELTSRTGGSHNRPTVRAHCDVSESASGVS